MKNRLENIDEIFKQKFENFEPNVAPSVWENIQNAISPTTGVAATENLQATSNLFAAKPLTLKLIAVIVAITTIAGGTYFMLNEDEKEVENAVELKDVIESKTINTVVANQTTDDNIPNNTVQPSTHPTIKDEVKKEVVETVSEKQKEEKSNEVTVISSKDIDQQPVEVHQLPSNKSEAIQNTSENKKEAAPAEPDTEEKQPDFAKKEAMVLKGVIKASVVKGKAPLDVNFDVDGANIVSYLWDFGDNATSGNTSPFHTYKEPGIYTVELIIVDENANAKTLTQTIEVEKNITSSLGFIPNAFSPNGDGINDVYELIATQNIKIFNAKVMSAITGKVVFEWNTVHQGWDGNDNLGRKLEAGSYYLTISAIGTDGTEHQKKLRINLLNE